MARIKYSGLLDDIRGKMGGAVFSVWKAGTAYVRKAAGIRKNPRSADQQLMRTWTQFLSGLWFSTLTAAQRALWEAYAATEAAGRHGGAQYSGGSGDIIPGNTGVMSGFNAFMMISLRLVSCGVLTLYDAATVTKTPPVEDPPVMVEDLAVTWNTPNFDITFTQPNGTLGTELVRLWIRSYNTACHRQLMSCALIGAASVSVGDANFVNGISLPFLNKLGVYDFQADVMTVTGVLSAPSQIFSVEAT